MQPFLVMRASQGDHEAFRLLVQQYSTIMLRTAAMIIGDHDNAEDIVQDALIQAWHHLPNLRNTGALRPWLMRIVVNQCITSKRRVNRSIAFSHLTLTEQELDLMTQIAADQQGSLELNWDLAQAVATLPIKQRTAIVLHYYYSMTLPEMAHTLATSENTLKKRIQAALNTLRRLLHLNDTWKTYRLMADIQR
jgi:RNA polymerase sigma-70 factor (ECF subfamily)